MQGTLKAPIKAIFVTYFLGFWTPIWAHMLIWAHMGPYGPSLAQKDLVLANHLLTYHVAAPDLNKRHVNVDEGRQQGARNEMFEPCGHLYSMWSTNTGLRLLLKTGSQAH